MEKKWFNRPPRFKTRLGMMMTGVFFQGFCLSLLRQFEFGTDPFALFTTGLTHYLPFRFGTCQLLCNLIMIAAVFGMDASYVGYGTVGNMVFVGYVSDLFYWIWITVLPAGFLSRKMVEGLLILPVLALFILAAAVYMSAGLGSAPYDALPFILAGRQRKAPFKAVRMGWDIAFALCGVLMGAQLGIVTVVMAFFLGPVIGGVRRRIEEMLKD